MKRKILYYVALVAIIGLIVTCKKIYDPGPSKADIRALVIEGVINNNDSTIIKLSRSATIHLKGDQLGFNAELKATVTVEDDQNGSFSLKETGKGYYASAPLTLNAARKYRLRVKTTDGAVFLSDLIDVKDAPPIDTVGYTTNAGLKIFLNTHDAKNNTNYYRWEYEETWKFSTKYISNYLFIDTLVLANPVNIDRTIPRTISVHTCFANNTSSEIMLGSTVKQSQDIVFQQPITSIIPESEKVSIRYSILVKQYVLSKEAYNFWETMKNNTINIGGIFDTQPIVTTSNIHCITDPSVPVVGYMSVGAVQKKRIFIDRSQLPNWTPQYPYSCGFETIIIKNVKVGQLLPEVYLDKVFDENLKVIGYTGTSKECSDCTIRGVLTTPSFWK